jgi:hypothetical protein
MLLVAASGRFWLPQTDESRALAFLVEAKLASLPNAGARSIIQLRRAHRPSGNQGDKE